MTRYRAAVYSTNPLQPSLGSLSKIVHQIHSYCGLKDFILRLVPKEESLGFLSLRTGPASSLQSWEFSTWRFEDIIFLLERCTDLIYGILSCSYWTDMKGWCANPSPTTVCFLLAFVSSGKCNLWAEICYFITSVIRVIKSVVCLKPQSVMIWR